MSWSFNPFTGNMDLTGSSGAVVFEGEVETFADLPEVVGDPPVGSSYLVRTSTGVWLVNRRQAGIWIRRNNTGVRATDWEYGGDYPVNSVAGKTGNVTLTNSDISGLGTAATADLNAISDADLRIVGSTDSTKKVAIEVDTNVPTNTVVTLTAPSSGGTIARTSDIPSTFAASAITSGVLDNARVNFAAPSAIGSTTPNTVAATDLSASNKLSLPSAAAASPTAGDLYRNANTIRYRDSTNTERLLLNATDNLSNLANTATARANLGLGDWATLSDGATLRSQFLTISDGESLDYIQLTAAAGVIFSGNRAAQFRGALGLGTSNNVTFGSIQNTPIGSTTPAAGSFSTLSATVNGLATTPTQGLTLRNSTAAASGAQQVSPFLSLAGQGWDSGTNSSREVEFGWHVIPVQANPVMSELVLRHRVAGGAWTNVASFFSGNNTNNTTVFTLNGAFGTTTFRRGGNNDIAIDQNLRVGGGYIRLDAGGSNIAFLLTDANDVFAQRNGVAAQEYRIYGQYTTASNFERLSLKYNSTATAFQIGTEKGTSGSARPLELQTDGVTRMTIATTGETAFTQAASFAHNVTVANGRVIGCNQINLNITSTALLALGTDSTIRWGAPSATAPLLKRSSTTLQVRLANDSDFAPLECAGLTLNGNLTASTRNIVTDTTTGTRIGTGTTQLLGFWNAAPSAQPAAVADATDAATVITQLNALLSRLRTIGIIAT